MNKLTATLDKLAEVKSELDKHNEDAALKEVPHFYLLRACVDNALNFCPHLEAALKEETGK